MKEDEDVLYYRVDYLAPGVWVPSSERFVRKQDCYNADGTKKGRIVVHTLEEDAKELAKTLANMIDLEKSQFYDIIKVLRERFNIPNAPKELIIKILETQDSFVRKHVILNYQLKQRK